ncbi:MAG: DUF3560 domain-containing protein [Actinobacteria bacterium]|nr:DUF3560 domain-containing protein [Actinomycetota bacterium]
MLADHESVEQLRRVHPPHAESTFCRPRLSRRANRRAADADAADAAARRALDRLPEGGEPIKVGHHSEGRHRSAIAKADVAMGRSVEADREATRACARADVAAKTTDTRYAPGMVARRIERIATDIRGYTRKIEGSSQLRRRVHRDDRPRDGRLAGPADDPACAARGRTHLLDRRPRCPGRGRTGHDPQPRDDRQGRPDQAPFRLARCHPREPQERDRRARLERHHPALQGRLHRRAGAPHRRRGRGRTSRRRREGHHHGGRRGKLSGAGPSHSLVSRSGGRELRSRSVDGATPEGRPAPPAAEDRPTGSRFLP